MIGIGGFLCPSVFAGQGRNVAKPAQKSARVPQASEPSRSRLNQRVQQGAGTATCGLRKALGAHIRRRVINTFEPVAQSVEHVTFNHGVRGSNPRGLASKIKNLYEYFEVLASKKTDLGSWLEADRAMPCT